MSRKSRAVQSALPRKVGQIWVRANRKDQFEKLIDIYTNHNGNPEAFSPEHRDKLYEMLHAKKAELSALYEVLNEQLRELTLLLGWSFDSRIIEAALEARLNFATFKAVTWDGTTTTKLRAIEAYFDAEHCMGRVLKGLTEHLGMKESDWQAERGES